MLFGGRVPTKRGTSNTNDRGSSEERRKRKEWLLREFGDGVSAPCAFACGTAVTIHTITVDRFPVPGCRGGRYRRGNIRPACGPCNSRHGGSIRRAEQRDVVEAERLRAG
jgi:hypothetical protein